MPRSEKKHRLAILFGLLVSCAILACFAWQLDWQAFAREIHKTHLAYLPVLVVILLVTFVIRALRWQYLLPDGRLIGLGLLTRACVIGSFATFILPLRAGELIRPWVLSRHSSIGYPAALASIVVERIFDALSILAMLAVCMNSLDNPPPVIVTGARALGVLAVLLLGGTVFCYVMHAALRRWIDMVLRSTLGRFAPAWSHRITRLAGGLLDGIRAVRSLGALLTVLLWSALLWLTMAAWYQLGMVAFGEMPPLLTGFLLNIAIALAVATPSAPGFIGTYQAGCVLALTVLGGYPQEFAIAYSVVTHIVQMVTVLVTGALVLHLEGLTFGSLRTEAQPAA